MNTPNTFEPVIMETITEFVGDRSSNITRDSYLEEDLDFDSTELISVIVNIEKSIGQSLKGIHYAEMKTIGDLIDGVDTFLSEKKES